MLTKKDLLQLQNNLSHEISDSVAKLRKEFKADLETAVAQVIEMVVKHCVTKEDLKEFKAEVKSEFSETRTYAVFSDLASDSGQARMTFRHEVRKSCYFEKLVRNVV